MRRNRYHILLTEKGPTKGYHIVIWQKCGKRRGELKFKGILEDENGNHLKERTKSARSKENADIQTGYLINRLTRDYYEMIDSSNRSKDTVGPDRPKPFSEALESLSEEERLGLYRRSWRADSTRKQAMAYFRKTYLPMLDAIGFDISPADCREITAKMLAKARENKNHGGNIGRAEDKVRVHIDQCQEMYSRLRSLRPELPEVRLDFPHDYKNVQTEQVKALPIKLQICLAAVLFAMLPNPLAMGALLMLFGGLRTAEACALCFEDFVQFCSWPSSEEDSLAARIIYQIKQNERSEQLKRASSYRMVLFGKIILDALCVIQKHLRNLGYTAGIEKLPVVGSANNPEKFANPRKLSRFIRELLAELGCGEDYWDAADASMYEEPDLDENGTALSDVTAYVLRRNFCSMMVNVCAMDPNLVDALMGHSLPVSCTVDWIGMMRDETSWPAIAQQMSRWVLLPEHTSNPAFACLPIRSGETVNVSIAQAKISVAADEDIELILQIRTREPGDMIEVRGAEVLDIRAGSTIIEQYEPVIGPLIDGQEYRRLIRSAQTRSVCEEDEYGQTKKL